MARLLEIRFMRSRWALNPVDRNLNGISDIWELAYAVPPGALSLDSFYPRDDRMKLVMAINTLLASPAFAAWTEGVPMDMDHLLGSPAAPRATIVSVAHLDEQQRRFVIALLTSELVAWMRRQRNGESSCPT